MSDATTWVRCIGPGCITCVGWPSTWCPRCRPVDLTGGWQPWDVAPAGSRAARQRPTLALIRCGRCRATGHQRNSARCPRRGAA